jgi:hypothetical protein
MSTLYINFVNRKLLTIDSEKVNLYENAKGFEEKIPKHIFFLKCLIF